MVAPILPAVAPSRPGTRRRSRRRADRYSTRALVPLPESRAALGYVREDAALCPGRPVYALCAEVNLQRQYENGVYRRRTVNYTVNFAYKF